MGQNSLDINPMDPNIGEQLIFYEDVKVSHEEGTIFFTSGAGKLDMHMKRNVLKSIPLTICKH